MAADAIASADVVVFAVWFGFMKQLLVQHSAALPGKIVIDLSNPVALDDADGYKKIIPQGESAGEIAAALLPPGARHVKAFGTQSALASSSGQQPPTVQFYATDDAGAAVADLIRVAGYSPFLIGGIDQSIRIEVFGDLLETTLDPAADDCDAARTAGPGSPGAAFTAWLRRVLAFVPTSAPSSRNCWSTPTTPTAGLANGTRAFAAGRPLLAATQQSGEVVTTSRWDRSPT